MPISNKRLALHHVGARNGSSAFPILPAFEKDIINVLYDADSDCLDQVHAVNQNRPSQLVVLPHCLGDRCASTQFNINYDPYTSSLLDCNPPYGSFYEFNPGGFDYVHSESFRTVEKRALSLVTLDSIFQGELSSAPTPDFLSIDTQGSEYEILQGARGTLNASVLALVLEVEFHPLYKGQKLFGDIAAFLAKEGFHFVSFLHLAEMSPSRAPIGLRGKGFHTHGEALFLRRIDRLGAADDASTYLMLRKLAFFAIVFDQFEYALQCLEGSREAAAGSSMIRPSEGLSYLAFLDALEDEAARMPFLFPDTFASLYSFEQSKARFHAAPQMESSPTAEATDGSACPPKSEVPSEGVNHLAKIGVVIRSLIRRVPLLYPALRKTKRTLALSGTWVHSAAAPAIVPDEAPGAMDPSWRLDSEEYSTVESLLMAHGLVSQANTLRHSRINQARGSGRM
jgi:FkbM family methyltransferase